MQTKITILTAKIERLRHEAAELIKLADRTEAELNGLARTPFGKPCSACGQVLETERDFAEHFEVPDPRWPNLGNCPVGYPLDQYPALARRAFADEARETGKSIQYVATHQRRGMGDGRIVSIAPSQYTDCPSEFDCNRCGLIGGH